MKMNSGGRQCQINEARQRYTYMYENHHAFPRVLILSRNSRIVMCRARLKLGSKPGLGLGFSRLRLAKTQARPSAEGWAWLGLGRAQLCPKGVIGGNII